MKNQNEKEEGEMKMNARFVQATTQDDDEYRQH